MRVLFITPNASLVAAVRDGLAPFGIDVTGHDNLVALYPQVIRLEPDVLLLDGDLPRLGLEATSKFLRAKGISRNLPIALYTSPPSAPSGWETEEDRDPVKLALQVNADDFVEKNLHDFKPLKSSLNKLAPHAAFDMADTGEHAGKVSMSKEGKPFALVVDDDPTIARLLRKILESRFTVISVSEGGAAVEQCRATNFAVVFCDLKMPRVSGPELYREVAAFNADLAARFVFVTAHQLDSAEAEFFLGLKNHVVHKPFSMRQILTLADQVTATVIAD